MANLWQDLRFALRILAKNPGFTFIAVLTLALGIGANTAIFSVLDSVLLRALPVAHPERLVTLSDRDSHGQSFGSEDGDRSLLAYSEFEYFRDHNEVFSEIFAADSQLPELEVTVSDSSTRTSSQKESARVRLVSGDYFATLRVTPAAGMFFTREEDRARGGAPITVISYAFWKQRFGLNPLAIGKTIQIRQTSFQIVGVTPPGFFGETVGDFPDLWVPMMMQDAIYPGRDLLTASKDLTNVHMWLQVMARLKPGISPEQAKASINVVFKGLLESKVGASNSEEQRRHDLDQRINLQQAAGGSSVLREHFGEPLKILMAMVGFVLLIACANVANLLLARGAARQREFAMRLAIGAGRARLIRQLLTEGLLIAVSGAAAGLLLAQWVDALLLRMVSGGASGPPSIHLDLQPDARVLGFTLGVTLLTTVLFALIPSLSSTRLNLTPLLKSTPGGGSREGSHRRFPAGKILVVIQVALSVILLVSAGLFVRSLSKLGKVNLGYNRENLLIFRVDAGPGGYKGAAIPRFQLDLLTKIAAIPGLRGVTVSKDGLFSGSESADPIAVEGYTPKPGDEMHSRMDHVGPGYFSTLGIPILMGREIETQDAPGTIRAGVINQAFVRRFFANTNPIGKHVRDIYPGNPAEMVVVGVVADAKYNDLREKIAPRIYAPVANPMWENAAAFYEVRTFADPQTVTAALRRVVQEATPTLPPIRVHTMSSLVDDSLQSDRFIEQLAGAFSLLALLLAAIGLYGLMAYTVSRRTRDIGIRLALGAEQGNVLWLVLRETLVLVLAGIAIGVPFALGGTQLMHRFLFGLGFADPIAILFAATLLTIVAAFAGFLPAWRASKVDPMVALRYE
ncbi:MAG TPA: ABC transporter permease [Candidatus Acidoferrum sp.]|nr:ABC transporter permease [Candidatus Acidoferrum sp.]